MPCVRKGIKKRLTASLQPDAKIAGAIRRVGVENDRGGMREGKKERKSIL